MTQIRSTNHEDRAISKILPFLRGRNMSALLAALIRPLQQAEDLAWEVIDGLKLDNAIGVQLDRIGRLVSLPRQGVTDDEQYRAILRGKILVNKSKGKPENIFAALVAMLGEVPFTFEEPGNATIVVTVYGVTGIAPVGTILRIASRAKAGGVRWHSVYPSSDPLSGDYFQVGTVGTGDDPDIGLGSVFDAGSGGRLMTVYSV